MTYPPQQPGDPAPDQRDYRWQLAPAGYPAGPPFSTGMPTQPTPKRTGLLVGLIVAAVVVIGGVVTLVVLLGPDHDDKSATEAQADVTKIARQYVAAIKSVDIDAIEALTCAKPTSDQKARTEEVTSRQKTSVQILGEPRVNGSQASLQVHITVTGAGTDLDQDALLSFEKQDDGWCLAFDWKAASGGA